MKAPSYLVFLLPALLLCSCGNFEKKWEASVAEYRAGKVSSPEGPWIGTWTTTTNGHTGDLRAIVSESKKKPGELDFHYHATWGKFFSGGYEVGFPAKKNGSRTLVDGEKNLGAFGTFGHRATITRSSFDATYSSKKGDLGTFEMNRP
jgi:hypothetical protein